jgi:hypothetical protein
MGIGRIKIAARGDDRAVGASYVTNALLKIEPPSASRDPYAAVSR